MHLGRKIIELAAHKLWLSYSSILFRIWKATGLRPRFLSSKGQDRWIVTKVFPGRRDGFFLEIGAGDGFTGSDTYVLEVDYGWSGLCIEANPALFETMKRIVQRNCICVNECVDEHARNVRFAISGDTSGIIADDTDNCEARRLIKLRRLARRGEVRSLQATTVGDLLAIHGAPSVIDYFSLDVEGAEERIVRSFPFSAYSVLAMTVERPTPTIHDILTRAGLIMVRHHIHDGFYLHKTIANAQYVPLLPAFQQKAF